MNVTFANISARIRLYDENILQYYSPEGDTVLSVNRYSNIISCLDRFDFSSSINFRDIDGFPKLGVQNPFYGSP